ncbi:hypothetical protein D3C84_1286120 [compost metagenome]
MTTEHESQGARVVAMVMESSCLGSGYLLRITLISLLSVSSEVGRDVSAGV